MSNTQGIIGGRQYRVTKNLNGHHFPIGAVVTARDDDSDAFVGVDSSGDTEATWFLDLREVELLHTERPTIDFSGDSRKTAREYARLLISRTNKPETNGVLDTVLDGGQVDAYRLNEAVLDAMRSVSTRFGQSPARREHGKYAAYLGHITQAVLENHADGLPVYEPGARSPRIRELESLLAGADANAAEEKAARLTAQERSEELSEALESAQARAASSEEIAERQAADLNHKSGLLDEAAEALRDAQGDLLDLAKEKEGLHQALSFATSLLRQHGHHENAAAVEGFLQGYKAGRG